MLRGQSHTSFLRQDIWNLNTWFKQTRNQGLSINDALVKYLKNKDIYYSGNTNKENIVRHLFIALPESMKLA